MQCSFWWSGGLFTVMRGESASRPFVGGFSSVGPSTRQRRCQCKLRQPRRAPVPPWRAPPLRRMASTTKATARAEHGAAPPTPETYRHVGILTGSQFVNNVGWGCVIPVLPIFTADVGMGAAGAGVLLSTTALSRLLCGLPLGRLADQVGRKPLMIGGQVVTSVASVLTGMSSTVPALLASRLLLGAGSSAAMAGGNAYMADITASYPLHRSRIMGFQSFALYLAYSLGPAMGGVLCDLYGARTSFFIVGAASLATTAGFSFLPESLSSSLRVPWRQALLPGTASANPPAASQASSASLSPPPPPPPTSLSGKIGGPDHPAARDAHPKSAWQVYQPLLADPNQQGLMGMQFAVFSSYSALMSVFPLHAMEVLGAEGSVSIVGSLFGVTAAVGCLGSPLGGYLADTLGRKNTVVPAACLSASGAILTAVAGVGELPTLVMGVVMWGLGNSVCSPGLSAFAADLASDEKTRGQALSLTRTSGDLALLLSPLGLGALAQLTSCGVALQGWAAGMLFTSAVFALRTTSPRIGKGPG